MIPKHFRKETHLKTSPPLSPHRDRNSRNACTAMLSAKNRTSSPPAIPTAIAVLLYFLYLFHATTGRKDKIFK